MAMSEVTTQSRMPSGTGSPVAVEHAGVHHQVADVAHQQQAAAGQCQSPPPSGVV